MATKPPAASILVLDLETSGTDETSDPILEVGWIHCAWDDDLTVIDSGEHIIDPAFTANVGDWRERMDPYVVRMHTDNGLFVAIDSGQGLPIETVEADLVKRIRRGPSGLVALSGSGVAHFDSRFIAAQMPRLDKRLAYWCLDVGVVRRVLQLAGRDDLVLSLPSTGKPHRALADARLHLDELRHYLAVLRGIEPGQVAA